MTKLPTIGFAGLTHLGVNTLAAVAEKGFDVVGYDSNHLVVADLDRGRPPVVEPELDALLAKNKARLSFSTDPSALGACDVVYISTDVPTDDNGKSDLSGISALIKRVASHLSTEATLVVLCQVPPGFTRALTAPALERRYYQVETLIFGRAVERALYPERYILGTADPAAPLPAAYARLLATFDCPLLPMRYESAELAKISINMCLVASVGVANTMAELCESQGADWAEIVPALKLDKRIGPYSYLAAGLGIAGGNLERDLATVVRLADDTGADAGIVRAWLHNSSHRKDWPAQTLNKHILASNPEARIALLGLAYKENTHSTKNAASLVLLPQLEPSRVTVYDPVVRGDALGLTVSQAPTALAAANGADVVVLITPWPEFKQLDLAQLAGAMKGRTVLDPYRLLDPYAAEAAGLEVLVLGRP